MAEEEISVTEKEIANANYLRSQVLDLARDWKSVDAARAQLIIEYATDAISLYGKTNQEQKAELRRILEKAELIVPPDSIDSLKKRAEKFILRLIYPPNQQIRNLLLGTVGVVVVGSLLGTSIIATRTFFPSKKQLTEQELKDKNFYRFLGDESAIDNPQEALQNYDEALKIDPDDEEIKKKANQLREKLMKKGESK